MECIGKERRCDEELAHGCGAEEQQSTVEGAPFQPQPPFFNEINGGHFIALPKQHLVSSERSPFKRVLVEGQHAHIQASTAKACNWCSVERSRSHFAGGGRGSPGRTPNAGSIGRPRDAFVHEGKRISPLHVSGVELFDVKSRRRDEIIDLAVEMTTAAEAFPTWCQAMLPPCYCAVGRQSMLYEQQAAIRTKHAPHFAKRGDDLRDRAQRPSRHHCVENLATEWNDFGRRLHQFRWGSRLPASSVTARLTDRCRECSPLARHRTAGSSRTRSRSPARDRGPAAPSAAGIRRAGGSTSRGE